MEQSKRETYFEAEGLKVEWEHIEGLTFLHCSLETLNKGTMVLMESLMDRISIEATLGSLPSTLYGALENGSFAEHFGWELLSEVDEGGKTLGVYKWEIQ